jgi:hypothetical protein
VNDKKATCKSSVPQNPPFFHLPKQTCHWMADFLLRFRENGDTRDLAILRENKPNFDLSNSDKLK